MNSTIFAGRYFFIDEMNIMEKHGVRKIIEDCGGIVQEYINDNITHVVVQDGRQNYFHEMLNSSVKIVSCSWVYICAKFKKMVPSNSYSPDKRSKLLTCNSQKLMLSSKYQISENYIVENENNFTGIDELSAPTSSEEHSDITGFSSLFESFIAINNQQADLNQPEPNEIRKSLNIEDNFCIPVPIRILINLITAVGHSADAHIMNLIEELKSNLNYSIMSCGKLLDVLRSGAGGNKVKDGISPTKSRKVIETEDVTRKNNVVVNSDKNDKPNRIFKTAAIVTNTDKKSSEDNDAKKSVGTNDRIALKNNVIKDKKQNDQNPVTNQKTNVAMVNIGGAINIPIEQSRGSSSLFESFHAKKTEATTKPGIVCTYFNQNDLKILYDIIRRLGVFEIENNVSSRTTHVICDGYKKTLNLHRALSRGCWVLSKQWIIASAEANRWLFEEKYERIDFNPAFRECRIERQEFGVTYSSDLFSGCGPMYVSNVCNFNHAEVIDLITVCGGLIVRNIDSAEIVVGNWPSHKLFNVKVDWVFNSVWNNRLSDRQFYRVT